MLATLIVASVFVNGANYGLAATKFAFGEEALARAMVYFVFNVFVLYTRAFSLLPWAGCPGARR